MSQLLNRIRQTLAAGELGSAGELLRESARVAPDSALLLHQLGIWLAMQQRYDQALAVLIPLEAQGSDPELLNDLGIVFFELGRLPEAGQRFERALALDPAHAGYRLNLADTHATLASTLLQQGKHAEALQHWLPTLQLDPSRSDVWIQVAAAYELLGDEAQAEFALLEALRIEPASQSARYNLGNLYFRRRAYLQAREQLELAVTLGDFAEAWINLGLCRYELGDYAGSLLATTQAVLLAPDKARFHIHHADSLLMNGKFSEGFAEIQWRFQDQLYQGFRFEAPAWQGESLAGRQLLIQAEQGLGDVLMFSRLIFWLHQRWPDACISFRCPPELKSLYQHWDWLDCEPSSGAVSAPDVAVAILSLAQHLNLNPLELPDTPPYLQASGSLPGALAAVWSEPSQQSFQSFQRRPRIGIVWSSGPGQTRMKRSPPLGLLAPLFRQFPQADFYSLQKGEISAELEPYREQIADLGPLLTSFNDTAHALHQLDLLIAVDTSVSHLAGALNLPVWILLPFAPDWRWRASGETSPWYPSARLMRQRAPGDWQTLISDQLMPALKVWLEAYA